MLSSSTQWLIPLKNQLMTYSICLQRKKELEMKKLDPGDYLEVAIIETRIHREEVRQRQVKEDVDDHTKYDSPNPFPCIHRPLFLSASPCRPACSPACLLVCLSVCKPASLPLCPSACLPVCLLTCLPLCLPTSIPHCLPLCLPTSIPPCLPLCLPTSVPPCLPLCLPTAIPPCLPLCLLISILPCLPLCLFTASLPAYILVCRPTIPVMVHWA